MKNYSFITENDLNDLRNYYNDTFSKIKNTPNAPIFFPTERLSSSCSMSGKLDKELLNHFKNLTDQEKLYRIYGLRIKDPSLARKMISYLENGKNLIFYPSIQNQFAAKRYGRRMRFGFPTIERQVKNERDRLLNSLETLNHENFESNSMNNLINRMEKLGLSRSEQAYFVHKYMEQQRRVSSSHMPGVLEKEEALRKILRKKFGYKSPVHRSWLQRNMNDLHKNITDQQIIDVARYRKPMPSFIFSKQGLKTAGQYGAVVGAGAGIGHIASKYLNDLKEIINNSENVQIAYQKYTQLIENNEKILSRKKLLKVGYIDNYFQIIVSENPIDWKELMLKRIEKYQKLLYLCGVLTSMTTTYLADRLI